MPAFGYTFNRVRVLFLIRENFLYCRITVNKKRCTAFSIHEKVEPVLWDAKRQKLKGGGPENDAINTRLGLIRAQIKHFEYDLSNKKKPITANILKELYLGKKKLFYTLIETSEKHIAFLETQPDEVAEGTVNTYKTKHTHLVNFLKLKKMDAIGTEEFTPTLADEFMKWMRTEKKPRPSKQSHAAKTLEYIRKVIRFSINKEWTKFNPLQAYTIRKGPHKMASYLMLEDIDKIQKKKFASERLENVKDIFVFLCHTGLSFRDISRFRFSKHCVFQDNIYWIDMSRFKTGIDFYVPISRIAYFILKKHGGETLPIKSNQKFNDYLKEIQAICGIEVTLTAKVGRTTFGVVMLNEMDTPIETVSKMLGHTSVRTTEKYYAKVLKQKIIRDVIRKNRGYYDIDPDNPD